MPKKKQVWDKPNPNKVSKPLTPAQKASAKAANFSITDPLSSAANKLTNKELNAYRNARKDGIQPASTKIKDIEKAVRMSDKAGKALQA